jgi:hypothetical protein
MGVGACIDTDPTRQNLLQCQELRQIVRQAQEEVVASHDLKPFESLVTHFENRSDVARYVFVAWLARFGGEVHSWIPNLQNNLAPIRISRQGVASTMQLIQAEMAPQPFAVRAGIGWPISCERWHPTVPEVDKARLVSAVHDPDNLGQSECHV